MTLGRFPFALSSLLVVIALICAGATPAAAAPPVHLAQTDPYTQMPPGQWSYPAAADHSIIARQLRLGIRRSQHALALLADPSNPEQVAGSFRLGTEGYALVRSAQAGIRLFLERAKFRDPVLEIQHKKIQDGRDQMVNFLSLLDSGQTRDPARIATATEYLAAGIGHLEAAAALLP